MKTFVFTKAVNFTSDSWKDGLLLIKSEAVFEFSRIGGHESKISSSL